MQNLYLFTVYGFTGGRPALFRPSLRCHFGQTKSFGTFNCIPVQILFPSLSTSLCSHEAHHFLTRM